MRLSYLNYFIAFALILMLNFALPRMMPGDPLQAIHAGEMLVQMTPEREAELIRRYAIDQPLPQQFLNYLGRLAVGDLGSSYYFGVPVAEVIGRTLPWTLLLAGSALILSSLLGIILGIEAGWRHDRTGDRVLTGLIGLLNGFPDFLLGAVLLILFGAGLAWFPVSGGMT
ncbi:MAG: ABC transporter permease, partial [Clostridia bacterium]|nr:ABC transporter permease [Clostridia bacterium]